MSLKYGWFGSELIKSCLDLEQLALYRRYSNDYYFYLDIPGLDVPALRASALTSLAVSSQTLKS